MAEESTNSSDLQDLLSDALEELKCNDVEADQPTTSKNSREDSAELTGKVSFEETLKMMNESLLQANTPNFKVPEEKELEQMFQEFASSFGSIDDEAGAIQDGGGGNNFMPIMESMMKSILSKDLLYPPLKELCSKYPDWLADNRTILSEKDYEQYNNQYLIAKEIVQTFEGQEADGANPTSCSKNQSDHIFELMQKMQTYGHPPKALIGDAPDPFDPSNAGMNGCPVQ